MKQRLLVAALGVPLLLAILLLAPVWATGAARGGARRGGLL